MARPRGLVGSTSPRLSRESRLAGVCSLLLLCFARPFHADSALSISTVFVPSRRALLLAAGLAVTSPPLEASAKSVTATAYVAVSEDGFIARKDGRLDWLNKASASLPAGDEAGFDAFLAKEDLVIMGRKTWDVVKELIGKGAAWPYGDKPVIVLSNQPGRVKIPKELSGKKIQAMLGEPKQLLETLGVTMRAKEVYVDGGTTIRSFLDFKALKKVIVTTVPVKLEEGIPLFNGEEWEMLEQVGEPKTWSSGLKQYTYRLKDAA
eukprot:TRINITY_DN33415_c0_g1_i1.p1 TRINITY_DN33415_c0_g1~~TRINITY_DN33415_c0_g1_i1.p1  ORF type:complete len:264 (+),score=59.67 TRINITY_DN33415_c0_g1_i1:45-836(+)